MIEWLQNWYRDQCDGNWEHNYGIVISTIDNPGWDVKVDLSYTSTEIEDKKWKLIEETESNWVGFKVCENKFEGSGDFSKLGLILSIFRDLVEKGEVDERFILSNMTSSSMGT